MTFLDKSFGEWNKVEKPTVVPMSNEGSNNEAIKMVSAHDENNNDKYHVVNNWEIDDENEENFLMKI